jgi:PAS domain S-box-containing protein
LKKEEDMDNHQSFLASNVINILDALDDGVYVTDKEGTTLHVNSMYKKLTGLTSEELLGQNVRVLREKGVFDTILNPTIVKTGKPETNVQTLQDGKRVVLRGFPVFDDNRELILVITLVRDVTLIEQMRMQIFQQKNLLSIYQNRIELLSAKDADSYDAFETPQIEKLVENVKQAAVTEAPMLLLGEAGTGKHQIARLAHDNSPRKHEIFLTLDCSSISEDRLEDELFGYVPEGPDGFTCADSEGRTSPFEAANKGTVFVDEIDALPLTVQEKLLRVLRDREVKRVGSPVPREVDVRLIAASNSDLGVEMQKGNFSRDLYNLLSEAVIEIPPLRETPEMIPGMVRHFLKRYGLKYKKEISCPDETISILSAYRWPGNFQELKNTLQSIVLTCDIDEILPQHLPPAMQA